MISRRATYVLALFGTIVVISMLWRPAIVADKVGSWAQSPVSHAKPYSVVDKSFLLLKTGTEVADGRLPPHFHSTLKRFPHNAIYADTNDTIDGREVIDCLSFLPTDLINHSTMKGYRVRMQMREQKWHWGANKVYVGGRDTGWDLDRFKNIPAYAEAWSRSQDFDWYVMIDADTYLPVYTLDQIVAGHNPDEILYFGKAVGWDPRFAHGGSGIVLSRGAMRAIFGTTEQSIRKALDVMMEVGPPECCGDSVVAKFVKRALGGAEPDEHLEDTEFGRFQGARTMNMIVKFDEWCKSVGTFHGVQPWEVNELSLWEEKYNREKKPILNKDFYTDFILPQVHNELPNWVFTEGPTEVDRRTWIAGDIEAKEKHACYEACFQDRDCMMWSFIGGEKCVIFRNLVAMGQALNEYKDGDDHTWSEVASGYMVDRIRERRQQQSCDGLRNEVLDASKREGWFNVELHQKGRDSTDLLEYKQVPLKITKPPKPPKERTGKPPHPPHPPHGRPEDGPKDGEDKPEEPESLEFSDGEFKRRIGPAPTFRE